MRILLIFILILSGCSYHHVKITNDGNFLFYNSPNVISVDGEMVVAYLNSSGQIIVQTMKGSKTVVHEYYEEINRKIGFADDHAAPAIILDENLGEILVATAYHGTDLHLYRLNPTSLETTSYKMIEGRFTYPRFLQKKRETILAIRNHKSRAGKLVLLRSSDGFETEETVLSPNTGEFVYAGSVAESKDGLVFHYSINSRKDRRLRGWVLSEYNTTTKEISNSCDLSYLITDENISNRPTGISQNNGLIVAATAYFDENNLKKPAGVFSRENLVLVVKGNLSDCKGFSKLKSDKTLAPYYHSSIAVGDDLEFAYFSNGTLISSADLHHCVSNFTSALYPTLFKGIYYAKMNEEHYQIRNFDNSLYYCAEKPRS